MLRTHPLQRLESVSAWRDERYPDWVPVKNRSKSGKTDNTNFADLPSELCPSRP